jgi:perosamine synthetase
MKIPLSSPDITEKERKSVFEVFNTRHLSLGPKLNEFEEKFAHYVGSKYAVAVNSGTSGLHLCVRALDIKEGDLVFTSPFSFVSSANCILFERAKPLFVDINEDGLNIDIQKLENCVEKAKSSNSRAKAILPVHIFGRPCEIDKIIKLADYYELKVIEDAAEATGAEFLSKGELEEAWKKVGTFGDCGVFAFYPNKQMTTGEGGMIVTDDEKIYRLCRSMRNQGRSEDGAWLQHERLGFNYRISDINCALGIAQLERIDEILAERERVALNYNERLKNVKELIRPRLEENKRISWFVYVVRLCDHFSREDRDKILVKLKAAGIGCSNYFSPIHLQPFYRRLFGYKEGDFPVTEKISERTIALPFYNNLREEEIDYVCDSLKEILAGP